MTYPVHYQIDRPAAFTRLQLAIRVIAFAALGILGISFGMVFLFGYLALPAYAATRLAAQESSYLESDRSGIIRVLRWFAAISAWAGLIADRLPDDKPDDLVHITIEGWPKPTPKSALWRVVTGLPSLLIFAVLCWVGVFVWVWAALSILVNRRVGVHAFNYLEGVQRWAIRLLAYQASLVDPYPPFSFSDTAPVFPDAQAMSK